MREANKPAHRPSMSRLPLVRFSFLFRLAAPTVLRVRHGGGIAVDIVT